MIQAVLFSLFSSLVIGALGFATPAWAYIPPSQFIVKGLVRKHQGYSSIQVRTQVIALENGQPTAVRFKEVTTFDPHTSVLRSWALNEAGAVLFGMERPLAERPLATTILFDVSLPHVLDQLHAAGIPTQASNLPDPTTAAADPRAGDKTALHRWSGVVAWVIGGTSKTKGTAPQLWVEKDTFLPLRVVAPEKTRGAAPKALFDFQMENFKEVQEFSYPRLANLYEVGKKEAILRVELQDLSVDHLSNNLPKEKVQGFTDAGRASSNELQSLLQTYYKTVR